MNLEAPVMIDAPVRIDASVREEAPVRIEAPVQSYDGEALAQKKDMSTNRNQSQIS